MQGTTRTHTVAIDQYVGIFALTAVVFIRTLETVRYVARVAKVAESVKGRVLHALVAHTCEVVAGLTVARALLGTQSIDLLVASVAGRAQTSGVANHAVGNRTELASRVVDQLE